MSRALDFLLGELSPEDAAAFERELAADASLRAEVEQLRPVVTRLEAVPDEAWAGPEPPPLVLPRAGGNRGAFATAPAAPGRRRRLRRGAARRGNRHRLPARSRALAAGAADAAAGRWARPDGQRSRRPRR